MHPPNEPDGRRRPPAAPIEPTLPLDMPRAEKPDPRPSGGRRGRTAPAAADGDLFGPGADATPGVPPPEQPAGKPSGTRSKRQRVEPAQPSRLPSEDVAGATEAEPGRGPKRKRRGSVEPVSAPTAPAPAEVMPSMPVGMRATEAGSTPRPDENAEPPDAASPLPVEPDGTGADGPQAAAAGRLSPDEVLLQKVEPRSFRPNERNDSWLYWLTDRSRADAAMRDGMPVEPDAPVLLSDRRAVLPKLAALAEDPDWAPNAIAVLRLRRIAVEPLLRPGPEPDSYVLAGEANVSA